MLTFPRPPSWDKLAPHELSFNSVWTAELKDSSSSNDLFNVVHSHTSAQRENKAKKLIKDQRDLNDSHTSSAPTPCQGKKQLVWKTFS